MAEPKDPPIPLRIPPELLQQIESVAALTGLSKQDVMRLCMRIGLVDLKAAARNSSRDLPSVTKQITAPGIYKLAPDATVGARGISTGYITVTEDGTVTEITKKRPALSRGGAHKRAGWALTITFGGRAGIGLL